MAKNPGILRNLQINRVALVDKGANLDSKTGDGAHIMLYKRDFEKDSPGLGPIHVDTAGEEKKNKNKKKKPEEILVKNKILKQFLGLFSETDDTKRAESIIALEKAMGDDDPDPDDSVHKADDAMCKCADCMSKRAKKNLEDEAVVEKRIESIEKRNVELQKALDETNAVLKAERESRQTSEMSTILKSFKATSFEEGDTAAFVKMKQDSPEMYERTMKLLKAQDELVAKSEYFKNIGSSQSGSAEGSAWAQIEAKADAIVAKGGSMTKEQAIEQVMDANPALVKQYRAEVA
jgi:hypothetical protein